MAAALLPPPEQQWIDANGNPLAGGFVYTYIPGSDTPKDTWSDQGLTVLNTNPVVLDAAGRAIIWGSGDFRLVVKDVNGVLVYDQITSAGADTDDTGFVSHDDLQAEIDRATAAESTLTTNLNSEIAARTSFDNALPLIQHGSQATDSAGHAHVDFVTGYSDLPSVCVSHNGTGMAIDIPVVAASLSGFDVWWAHPDPITGAAATSPVGFFWIAIGPR